MSPKNPETPVRIENEIDFRQKVGLSGSPISLDWKKDRVIETTEGDLARLRADIRGHSSADDKQKAAEAFLRAQEKEEAEGDISDRLTAELWNGVKDKLIKSGVVTGALASGAALAHVASAKIEESTGIKMNLWDKFQSWAREEHKTATGIRKWILGLIAGKGKEETIENPEMWPKPQEGWNLRTSVNETLVKATAVILAKVSPTLLNKSDIYKDQKNISIILTMPQILDMKYGDAEKKFKKFTSDKSIGIGQEFWIKGYTDTEIYKALYLLFADEKIFSSLFAPKKWDISWKSKSVAELFQVISRDIKVFERMENAAKAASAWEFQKLLGSEDESEGTHFDGKAFAWDMKDKIDVLMNEYKDKWLTTRVATDIMMNPDSLNGQAMRERGYTEKEISFIEYLKSYTKTIWGIISSDTYGGKDSHMTDILASKPMSLKESFRFFLITTNSQSVEEMNVFAQYKLYGYTRSIIKARNNESSLAGFDSFIFKETKNVITNWPSIVPVWVQNLLKRMTDGAKQMAVNWLEENLSYGWELIKKNPALAIPAIALVAGTFVLGRVVFASKIAGVTALTIGAIAVTLWFWEVGKSLETEGKKLSR